MAEGIDREKCYEDAVLHIVKCEEFEDVSAKMIGDIARFAVDYAEAGWRKGRGATSKQKRNLADATQNISVDFRGNFRIDISLTEEDAKEVEERIKELFDEIGSRY